MCEAPIQDGRVIRWTMPAVPWLWDAWTDKRPTAFSPAECERSYGGGLLSEAIHNACMHGSSVTILDTDLCRINNTRNVVTCLTSTGGVPALVRLSLAVVDVRRKLLDIIVGHGCVYPREFVTHGMRVFRCEQNAETHTYELGKPIPNPRQTVSVACRMTPDEACRYEAQNDIHSAVSPFDPATVSDVSDYPDISERWSMGRGLGLLRASVPSGFNPSGNRFHMHFGEYHHEGPDLLDRTDTVMYQPDELFTVLLEMVREKISLLSRGQ